jgi:hypothetical protein
MKTNDQSTGSICDKQPASVRRLVRLVYLWKCGVRGAVKPPINWNRTHSLAYRLRYRAWKIEDAIYRWTGLPNEWWRSVTGRDA